MYKYKLNQAIYPLLPNSQHLYSNEAIEVQKNIRVLINELIGEDEPVAHAVDSVKATHRNELREQLRQKVELL